MKAGGEEYLNSEKYELKSWDIESQKSLAPLIETVNRARRENTALQNNHQLFFNRTDNPYLISYTKQSIDTSNVVLVFVNLDPFHVQAGWVDLDLAKLGLSANEPFQVHDQITGRRFKWQGRRNFVELSPNEVPAHIFRVLRRVRSEKDFDYYL